VLSSSTRVRLAGLASMLAGLVVWLFTGLLLRRQYNRNQLILPFAELLDTLRGLRASVLKVQSPSGVNFDRTLAQLAQLEQRLTERALSDVIPSSLPSLLGNEAGPSPDYQQRLNSLAEQVGAQVTLVQGISDAWAKWNNNAAQQAPVKTAMESLDALNAPPAPVSTQSDAQNRVAGILTNLTTAIATLPGAGLGAAAPGARPLPTLRELQIKNQHLNYVAWIVWFVLTLAIGYYVMIAAFPGFGAPSDLWKCFFWGLSIPLVGQQLQQLNPTTISTTLNLSIPKV
jgi:hypothetical protein